MRQKSVGYSYVPLVTVEDLNGNHVVSVPINHGQLDTLVGQLMQMFDLNGDVEQRNAQKSSAKQICRDWLDSCYKDICGYDKWRGEVPGGTTLKLDRYKIELGEGPISEDR